MAERLVAFVRGLSSLVALTILVAGPPVALTVFVGWPLPEGIPTLDELTIGARSGIDPTVIIKTLAVIGWLAWAQIALSVLIETAALIRRTPAPHLPVMPGLQLGAGRLLAGAALLFASLTPTRPAVVPLVATTPITDVAPEHAPSIVRPSTVPAATPIQDTTASSTATVSYRVERHDSWWQIAENSLGDGLAWQQIRALNTGRTMPDGTTITPTTEILLEGWNLLVPGNPDHAPPDALTVPPADVVVEPGDNLWDLAEDHLEEAIDRQAANAEITPYWLDVIDENRPRLHDPANPSLIHPGQRLHLPAHDQGAEPTLDETAAPPTAHPEPESSAPPTDEAGSPALPDDAATATPSTTTPGTTASAAPPTTTPSEPEDPSEKLTDEGDVAPIAGALGTAGTLLAVGLSAAVLRRRRRREQHLLPGTSPPDPPEALDELRTELNRRADTDHIETLGHAMAAIATALARHRDDARARIVQASSEHIEVYLSQPVLPAPDGWRPEASGSAWVLDDPAILDPNAHPPGAPTHPLLVSIGRVDAEGQLYLDLEAEGLINLHGPADAVAGFLRSVLMELAVSPFASGAGIYLCGDIPGTPEPRPDRTIRVDSWDAVADSALAWAQQTRDLQATQRWATPPAGRCDSDLPGDLAPLVVVVGEQPDDERFDALCTTISESIVPVVVIGAGTTIEGATTIQLSDHQLHIPALGLTCTAQKISAETAHDAGELLAVSEQIPEPPEQLELTDTEPAARTNGHRPTPPCESYTDPPYDILVKVLGDIEVVGGNEALTPKPTAIVTYLALHNPATAERVEDAIWSGPAENRRKRLINTISDTRTALGAEHLPTGRDGKYHLGPGVITDLELLERRVQAAANQTGHAATETLRGALELVTGPVFTYRNADRAAYAWVDTDNWISSTELKITGLAEDLAQRYLDADDVDGAIWAASRGLAAVPTHSRLTAVLMRAHAAAGDPDVATTVYESHLNALDALDLDDVDPDLADLYQEIRAARRGTPR